MGLKQLYLEARNGQEEIGKTFSRDVKAHSQERSGSGFPQDSHSGLSVERWGLETEESPTR